MTLGFKIMVNNSNSITVFMTMILSFLFEDDTDRTAICVYAVVEKTCV